MLQHNQRIEIATAGSRRASHWLASTLWWSEFIERISSPQRSPETLAQYLALPKAQQDDLKDVGGFVGGTLLDGRRKSGSVLGRDLLTLDLDNIPAGQAPEVLKKLDSLGCAYAVYSTRKHRPDAPRLRVVWVCNRPALADEYEPLLRKMADLGGLLDWCDPSTFEVSRLMYWPSVSADGEYLFQYGDKPKLDVAGVLALYSNWKDISSWPTVPGQQSPTVLAAKQGDPTTKTGVVGAFCRSYDILSALETFLPGMYTETELEDRYTYAGGSTSGGAIIYDGGQFLYSHHATDPCGGKLVNAFDLVRLHKFEELDDAAKPGTPVVRMPSFSAMCELAVADSTVAKLLNKERLSEAQQDFPEDSDWMLDLQVHPRSGLPEKTIDNVWKIMENDPQLKGKFALNEFAGRGEVLESLPWNKRGARRLWEDNDSQGLYWYLEKKYQITGPAKIDGALSLHSTGHSFNDVTGYLKELVWDEKDRLDRLFIDYLGAVDTPYTRAITRKAFTAAVARAMVPGTKFDNMTILSGPQGIGKSTLFSKMSKGWFNDSIRSFEGKEASELLQGVWLVEISELDAFRRTDVSRIKQFLSLQVDRFRAAYGRHVKEVPRCCIFFGTTNSDEYLQDRTGNRRFWPVDVGKQAAVKSVWEHLDGELDQLWAEAVHHWRNGEPLYLTGEIEQAALESQESHREASTDEGIIEGFLEKKVPVDWDDWDAHRRRMFWSGELKGECELVARSKVCAVEVWVEALGMDQRYIKISDSSRINQLIAKTGKWEKQATPRRFGYFAQQRGFQRLQSGDYS